MYKAGATDYVLKNQLTRLPIAVENALQKRENTPEKNKAISLLKSSEERFRRLAENAQDIIHRFSYLPEPHFEYINPAVTKITCTRALPSSCFPGFPTWFRRWISQCTTMKNGMAPGIQTA